MLRPLHKNVILRLDRCDLQESGGIVLKTSASRPCLAVVEAVGPDVEDQDYGPGDVVVYHPLNPVSFAEGDHEYLILQDEDIPAVPRSQSLACCSGRPADRLQSFAPVSTQRSCR